MPLWKHLQTLAIASYLPDILQALKQGTKVLQLVLPTGSGKTMGVPHAFLQQYDLISNESKVVMQTAKPMTLPLVPKSAPCPRLLVALPTVVTTASMVEHSKKVIPMHPFPMGHGYGGHKSRNFSSAPVVYATTQTIINWLLPLLQKAESACLANQALDCERLILMIDEAHHPSSEMYLLQCIANWMLSVQAPLQIILSSATLQVPKELTFLYPTKTVTACEPPHKISSMYLRESIWTYDRATGQVDLANSKPKILAHALQIVCDTAMEWAGEQETKVSSDKKNPGDLTIEVRLFSWMDVCVASHPNHVLHRLGFISDV